MDEEEGTQYLLELEKLMSSQIASAYWAPTMDILAIVTFDNLLEGYRISFKAQRFFHIQESQSITTLCFSPDSQYIVYSLLDGSTKIIRTENGERIVAVQNLGCQSVQNLTFVPFAIINPEQFMPFTKNSIESKLILNISPHKNCNKNAIIKINYFNSLKDNFICLLQSQRHKTWLLLNGFAPIACIDHSKHLKLSPNANQFRVLYNHLDEKLYTVIAEQIQDTYNLQCYIFDAEPILQIKQEIVKYNCLITNIGEIFNFIQTTYGVLQTSIRDIIRQYNSKINLIDDSSSPDIVPRQQLLKYLSIGLTSSTLMNFFTKQVYDTKVLQKLDQTLTSLFASLHDIIIESVQNSLQKATLLLLKLVSYSQVQKFQQFGIKTEQLKQIQLKIGRLYNLGESLLVESTQTKFNIRNLLIWLNKASIKTSQQNETEIQNSKSYLNKYTVDYSRLHKFLIDEDVFRLQNLLKFFVKSQQKNLLNIPKPDFGLIPSSKSTGNTKLTQQQLSHYHSLEKQLQIEDIKNSKYQEIQPQILYETFKLQIKHLLSQWKQISSKPSQKMGEKLTTFQSKHEIGKITITQLFPFEPKFIYTKQQHLMMYYIDHDEEQYDRIIRYNCTTQTKSYLYCDKYTIESITVAEDIIGIFQEKMGEKKIIAQIANQKFDGGELVFGKKISNCDQGELRVQASPRGLNALIIGKTKLVVFD